MPTTNRLSRTADQANYALNRRPENLRASLQEMIGHMDERIAEGAEFAAKTVNQVDAAVFQRGVEFNARQRDALIERLRSLTSETSILCAALDANDAGDEELAGELFARLA
jgi:hypothetical protein